MHAPTVPTHSSTSTSSYSRILRRHECLCVCQVLCQVCPGRPAAVNIKDRNDCEEYRISYLKDSSLLAAGCLAWSFGSQRPVWSNVLLYCLLDGARAGARKQKTQRYVGVIAAHHAQQHVLLRCCSIHTADVCVILGDVLPRNVPEETQKSLTPRYVKLHQTHLVLHAIDMDKIFDPHVQVLRSNHSLLPAECIYTVGQYVDGQMFNSCTVLLIPFRQDRDRRSLALSQHTTSPPWNVRS